MPARGRAIWWLPIFALANAGVVMVPEVISGRQTLMFAIIVGLMFGKPLGLLVHRHWPCSVVSR